MKNLLIIFVKNPELGKVKSRLAKSIGNKKALSVYKKLLKRTKEITIELPMDKCVYYSDVVEQDDLWENHIFQKKLQKGNDLGERMYNAFKEASNDSYHKICLIGSDLMELTNEIVMQAFRLLDNRKIVLGPSFDGGYYLIAMKAPVKELFLNKKWSTKEVFSDAIHEITTLNLDYATLPKLNDIDDVWDIKDGDRDYLFS
jgi:rSAM/selenodomain-associated transferase 1